MVDLLTVHPVLGRLEMEGSAQLDSADFEDPSGFSVANMSRMQDHGDWNRHCRHERDGKGR